MLVLSGPVGSGKGPLILSQLQDSIRRRDWSVRLLVPRVEHARYIRHQLAQQGLAFPPRLVQTLAHFVDGFTEGTEVTRTGWRLATQAAVDKLARPEFAAVAQSKGFLPLLAARVEEILSGRAGAGADSTLYPAVAAVAAAAKEELDKRGLHVRARRFARAAERIRRLGLGSIHTIWLDGLASLDGPELDLAAAFNRHADVTVTLPEDAAIPDGCRAQKLETQYRRPAVHGFCAASPMQEASEIIRRILKAVESGREFRDIGIVVRDRRGLAPIESALERFGAPYRVEQPRAFAASPLGLFCRAILDAARNNWEHQAVLRFVSRQGTPISDEFDFAVRKQLPGNGLDALRSLSGAPLTLLNGVAAAIEPADGDARPAEWADRLRTLPPLMAQRSPSEEACFDALLDETAAWFPPAASIPFDSFARAVAVAMDCAQVPAPGHPRNAVHLMTAEEGAYRELAIVFICGLVEGGFPRERQPDAFLGATGGPHASDERRLFDAAVAQAASEVILSYPRSDSSGGVNHPSRFLEGYTVEDCSAPPARPRPSIRGGPKPRGTIYGATGLAALEARHGVLHPSGVETYLRCPFQFFGRFTLDLKTRPARPEERLDFKLQGTILHESLAAAAGRPIEEVDEIFDRVFRRQCAANAVPRGYRVEFLRRQMLEDLRRFLLGRPFPAASRTLTEARFELTLAGEAIIRGRIDRIDIQPDGRGIVIDYKRTAPDTDAPALAQAPLYALACERALGIRPAGVFYCGLREKVRVTGWAAQDAGLTMGSEALTEEWLAAAERTTIETARQIRAGRFEPAPVTEDLCPRCEYRDVCRYQGAVKAEAATNRQ